MNPFTPSFGSVPPLMAGREELIEGILNGLDNAPGDPNRTTIFIGARGTGKTALLSKIADEAESRGWVSANVTAVSGMLEDVIQRSVESAKEFGEKQNVNRITSLSAFGFSFTREVTDEPKGNWRTQMNRILDELNAQGVGLLITIDEVGADTDEMRILAAAFQHFVRERRNTALIMAGLPQQVSALLSDKKISFLRKAFQHYLDPIPLYEVRDTMRRTVELSGRKIGKQALDEAADATGGFPFLIQLIGYHVWRQHTEKAEISHGDVIAGVEYARADMERMIFIRTLDELSDGDRAFLNAMSVDEKESRLSDIKDRLGVSSNYANQYRIRLMEQGIIGSRGRGKLGFEIPMLRDYLRSSGE
jgi:hypothetical protein